jgi:hypothetical protein
MNSAAKELAEKLLVYLDNLGDPFFEGAPTHEELKEMAEEVLEIEAEEEAEIELLTRSMFFKS